jgi:hypothetical protein
MDTAVREPALRRTPSGNLTAALVAFAVLELFVNRVFSRLFASGASLAAASPGFHGPRLVDDAGPLLFNLTAVLALGLFVTAFSGLIRRQELYPRAMRYAVAIIALFFAVLAGRALVRGQLPSRHFVYLEICFAFLMMLTVLALVRVPTSWRVKLGVTSFALPGVLRAFAIVGAAGGAPGAGPSEGAALASAGELALVAACIAAPILLPVRPLRERPWRLALGVASAATAAFVAALLVRFDLVQASVLYGLRIDLPRPGSVAGVAHVAAFFGWTYATTQLLGEPGGMRLAGYGLMLLALGGYETGSPVELSLSLLGLVALTVGELRAAPAPGPRASVTAPAWRDFVGRLGTAASDASGPEDTRPEAVVVSDGDIEMSRITTYRRGYPVSIKLRRRRGRLVEMDATLGTTGHNLPDASIERHRRWLARSPEHRLKLARLKTGDPSFDQKFSVHGDAPLGDEELRRRVARQQGDGVLTIWLGGAARYQLAHPSSDASDAEALPVFAGTVEGNAPVASIVELLDTLADLVEASLPAAS